MCAFLALLAPACDPDGETSGNGSDTMGFPPRYVGVRVAQPGGTMTRAATAGFEYGTEDENYVQDGLFFIFSADGGDLYGKVQRLALTGEGTGKKPETGRVFSAMLVIDGVKEKPSEGLQVVCVLNAPQGLEQGVATLADLTGKIGGYGAHTRGRFIMTNTVYKEGGAKKLGATITADKIFDTADQALAFPVDIYVERVDAKVKVSPSSFKITNPEIHVDGKLKKLDVKVTGVSIANISQKSYLFKNIDGIDAGYGWAWDGPNRRSYWEKTPARADQAYGNNSYEDIAGKGFDMGFLDLTEYVQPNTSELKTAVLVTAELQENGVPFDFVYLRGGYFKAENALHLIAEYAADNGFFKKTKEDPLTYEELGAGDFQWVNKADKPELTWLRRGEVVAEVKPSVGELYRKEGDLFKKADAAEVNKLLDGNAAQHPYVARYYKDGKCYYYADIDHSSVALAEEGTYVGVVRNHVYELKLRSLSGMGIAVFDPSDEIIPEDSERPGQGDYDNLFYVGAEVNVLAWKLAYQEVDL